jgi:hypothetical protein
MIANSQLTAADIKNIARLAEKAECLRGVLSAVDLTSARLQEGMLLACSNFAEDIGSAVNAILARYAE